LPKAVPDAADIDSYLDTDLAFLLEEPDVDARDLLLHVLAATIEVPEWPAVLAQLPSTPIFDALLVHLGEQ
jgi:hypothetical protein